MSNYQQHLGPGGQPYAQQQQPQAWAQQAPPAPQQPAPAPPAGRRLFGPVNWRVVRISIPIIVVVEGLITALAWPAISRQTQSTVAMHKLVEPPAVTLNGLPLNLVPLTSDDRPGTDAETDQTGHNKQDLGLTRLDSLTYSPDGRMGSAPGYQVFSAYGDIKDPAARMKLAIANIKVVGAQQLGPMLQFPAKGNNSGDVPIECTGMEVNGAMGTEGWCTWSNRSTIGTVTLISQTPGGPSAAELGRLADATAQLRDQMYAPS
ncbi:hypothetical protein ACIGXM_35225 [Kitasatospora sp. NPDC052896]|uniref:hypothetical protein n=1 Tax=Kitasatospora sp. NPDC052896 TaxID=3364061 RepID=UPI0037C67F1B